MAVKRPVVAVETDYTYTDKASGRQLSFEPSPHELMVTFQGPATEQALNAVIRATPLLSVSQGFDGDRGFAAVYVSPDQGMEQARRSLQERPEIANSLPALVDPDGLTRYFVPDELTVQFRRRVSKERAERIIRERRSRVLVEQRTPGYYTLLVPDGRGLFETIREFSDLDEVQFAEPSEVGFNDLLYLPNDPDFPSQWGLHNTGQTIKGVTGVADADIDMPNAWELARGDREVIVAVIDTGTDLDHPDLQANILPRGGADWNFADPVDPIPEDTDGHGTHVAGIIAAVDNDVGVVGVAPGCRVMPLRIDTTPGMNQNRADAINFVAQEAPANLIRRYVINCSWKTGGDHAGVRTAIQTAVNTNIVVVFAAGNANTNMDVKPEFPGVYPEVISVTSVDNRDRKPWLSNFGSTVDVAAPGENIFSTLPGGGHGFDSGTSMAAPHVAGLAALIWSVDSSLTNQQVRHVIETTCDNVDATNPGFVGMLGRGRVNAAAAVRRLKTTVPNVRERPPSTASKMVAAAHLVPKFVYLPGPTGPQAWVSHQSPHAGAKVDVGSTVTLTIRKGRKP